MSDHVDHKKPFTLRKLDAMSAGTSVPVPAILEAQSAFSLNLLRSQNALQSSIMSPISISIALAMVCLGAKDETAKQIRSAIAQNATDEELHAHFAGVVEILQSNSLNVTLDSANRVYIKEGLKLLDSYTDAIKKNYGGQFEQVDFTKSAETAAKINQFVEEATHQKIKDLISADSLDDLTRLILVNAVYFKGDWQDKFSKDNTIADHDFYVSANETKKVEMMTREDKYIFYEAEEYQVLGLPYKGENVFMFVVLPKEKDGLSDLLQKLNGPTLAQLLRKRAKSKVNVKLPKFKIESSFDLGTTLESVGITQMFTDAADFSGITGTNDLKVSKVVHKAFIEVNEEGAEAAAATAIHVRTRMRPKPVETHVFVADHPFVFVITDDNGHILFTGNHN